MFIGSAELGLGLPGIPKGARFHTDEDKGVASTGPATADTGNKLQDKKILLVVRVH